MADQFKADVEVAHMSDGRVRLTFELDPGDVVDLLTYIRNAPDFDQMLLDEIAATYAKSLDHGGHGAHG